MYIKQLENKKNQERSLARQKAEIEKERENLIREQAQLQRNKMADEKENYQEDQQKDYP